MSSDLGQLFFIDPAIVENSATVYLSKVKLFFSAKPDITNNKSGIYAPGAHLFVCETNNNVPSIDPMESYPTVGVGYGAIVDSSDASIFTEFTFNERPLLNTDAWYAFIVKFDGNEDFYLWENIKGNFYVNTQNISGGSTAKYVGPLYGYISSNSQASNTASYLQDNWKPVDGTVLKFEVDVARFAYSNVLIANSSTNSTGNSVTVISNNTVQITAPSIPSEYISFDFTRSNINNVLYGDYVYQDRPYHPGKVATPATCSVTNGVPVILANTSYVLPNGTNFSFKQMYSPALLNPEYIVVTSLNHYGSGQHAVNVRRIQAYFNDTQGLMVTEPLTFTNTNAYFFKSPIGRLSSVSRNYIDGTWVDLAILNNSNANNNCRFVNNCINAASINAGGTGYANTDYVVVSGYEDVGAELSGGYSANLGLSTNSTGGIIALYLGNTGAGFTNTQNITYTVKNANNVNSAGSGSNLAFTVDAVLKTESSGGAISFYGSKVINVDFAQALPDVDLTVVSGIQYGMQFMAPYYMVPSSNTLSAKAYYLNPNSAVFPVDVQNQKTINFHDLTNMPVIPSRSNQFSIRYANGAVPDSNAIGMYYSNAAVYSFLVQTNNDFTMLKLSTSKFDSYYDKYNINNDYTGEEGNFGNAVSKDISTKVTLQNDQFAEDLIAYITGWRPSTTDFKVYGKVYNSHDSDAFDDKDWSLLEQVDGIGVYSILTNQSDMKQYTYNLPAYPNSAWTDAGSVTTQLSSNVIVGSGTNFSNLAQNDLVKIYQPLFPNGDYMIAVVSSVTNTSQLTLTDPVTNVSMTGSGFKIDKIAYPHQAFNDVQNDNVATYFNSNMAKFTTFDTFSMKTVYLSPFNHIVPKMDDLSVVATSA